MLHRVREELAVLDPRQWDALLAWLLAAGTIAQLTFTDTRPMWRWLPPALLTTLPLAWRRRYPIATMLVAGLGGGLYAMPPALAAYAGYLIALYSIGRYAKRRLLSLSFVICGFIGLQVTVPQAGPPLPRQTFGVLIGIGLWLAGNAIRARRQELAAAAAERDHALHDAVAEERARIARELHDVVAHGVSLMTVQAGAARRQLHKNPDHAEAALKAVEAGGREALAELRRMLGLLRPEDAQADLTPQPGLDQLDRLIGPVKSAGQPVTVRIEGTRRELPPGVDLAAYRIAQEALTNAVKHAPGAPTQMNLTYGAEDLRIQVLTDRGPDHPHSQGTGRGLLGMRERAAVYGGEVDAVEGPNGVFMVSVRLPVKPE